MRRSTQLIACLAICVPILGWVTAAQGQRTRPGQGRARATPETMAQAACDGVGVVKQSSMG